MPIPYADLRKLNQDFSIVELYVLDATTLGGIIYYWCNEMGPNGLPIVWGGNTYYPLPIGMSGFQMSVGGAPPRPTLEVSNVGMDLLNAVQSLGNLTGATIQRFRVLSKHLPTGASPDPANFIGPDTYLISAKTLHTNSSLQFECISVFDRPDISLPRQKALKDPTSNSQGFPGLSRRRVS